MTPAHLRLPAASTVPYEVMLLFPQDRLERLKVGSTDDTVPIDSGRLERIHSILGEMSARARPPPTSASSQRHIKCGTRERPWIWRRESSRLDEMLQKRGRWPTLVSLRDVKHGLNDTAAALFEDTTPRTAHISRVCVVAYSARLLHSCALRSVFFDTQAL